MNFCKFGWRVGASEEVSVCAREKKGREREQESGRRSGGGEQSRAGVRVEG